MRFLEAIKIMASVRVPLWMLTLQTLALMLVCFVSWWLQGALYERGVWMAEYRVMLERERQRATQIHIHAPEGANEEEYRELLAKLGAVMEPF